VRPTGTMIGRMERPLPVAATVAAATATIFFVACTSSPARNGLAVTDVSGRMPALSGRALEGGTVGAATYRGRPVVVNFWATWCGPCRREQPALSAAHREAGPDGPVFIGVNFRDDLAAARAYLRELGVDYPSLEDASGSLAYAFDVPYLPATIFVDATGEMRYRAVGALDARHLDELIERISSPTPSAPGG
jgi:cytochrome c biogenesis protein CcmG, thiol:disulfide interchange protein DsbE